LGIRLLAVFGSAIDSDHVRAPEDGVCEPLFEAEPGLFATRQMAALTERMDTAWLRRLDLELMAR
jgi:hypothetical protein